jgi:ribonuclease P protein component
VQRLKTRGQFQAVLAGGTVARTTHFSMHRAGFDAVAAELTLFELSGQSSTAQRGMWIGAMVPKRLAKRAVTRNAIRRQIHNVGADFRTVLSGAAHVVRLRAGFDNKQYFSATSRLLKSVVRSELRQLFAIAALPPSSTTQGS